jgi:hypothetical protein
MIHNHFENRWMFSYLLRPCCDSPVCETMFSSYRYINNMTMVFAFRIVNYFFSMRPKGLVRLFQVVSTCFCVAHSSNQRVLLNRLLSLTLSSFILCSLWLPVPLCINLDLPIKYKNCAGLVHVILANIKSDKNYMSQWWCNYNGQSNQIPEQCQCASFRTAVPSHYALYSPSIFTNTGTSFSGCRTTQFGVQPSCPLSVFL